MVMIVLGRDGLRIMIVVMVVVMIMIVLGRDGLRFMVVVMIVIVLGRDNHRRLDDRQVRVIMVRLGRDNHGLVQRMAEEHRSAFRRRFVHLAGERHKGHSPVVAGLCRDNLGGLLPGARNARRAVELREAFLLQLAVLVDLVGGQGDAEGAGLVHLPHGLALVLSLAVLALDNHLKT
jgi:hypothetical protein